MYSEYGSKSFSLYLPSSTVRRAKQNNVAEMLFQGYLSLARSLFLYVHFGEQKTEPDTRET